MNYKAIGKRAFDLALSLLMLLCLLPIFLVLIPILSVHFRSSPFYSQVRLGRQGVYFNILKFKTMGDHKGLDGNPLPDELRITPLGKVVRNSSLDEIPQLLNVLKGDMSLVGPRPLLAEYLSLYDSLQARRHEVKPGVTGWAQINGRNAISWKQKFNYDVWYVDNLSFLLDVKILFHTSWNVIQGKGITQHGYVTTGKFTGSN